MDTYHEQIAAQIKEVLLFLDKEGFNLKTISKETGISYSQLSRFQSGKNIPGLVTARRAILTLDHTYEDILVKMPKKKLTPAAGKIAKQLQVKESRLLNYVILERILEELEANGEERKEMRALMMKLEEIIDKLGK